MKEIYIKFKIQSEQITIKDLQNEIKNLKQEIQILKQDNIKLAKLNFMTDQQKISKTQFYDRFPSAALNFVRQTTQSSPSFCSHSALNQKAGNNSTMKLLMSEFSLPAKGTSVHGVEILSSLN